MRDTKILQAAWDALSRTRMVIQFDLDGHVLWANDLFLETIGYKEDMVLGQHHRMFCTSETVERGDYELTHGHWEDSVWEAAQHLVGRALGAPRRGDVLPRRRRA